MIHTLPDIFPPGFSRLALAHFAALLSPGPDFFLIIGHAARGRLRASAGICCGIAAGNAVYILLALAGWNGVRQAPALYRSLELAGAAYLAFMGCMLLRRVRKKPLPDALSTARLSVPAQVGAGLGSALLNPKNAVFYLTLMTALLPPQSTLIQQVAAGTWMTLAVLFWDLALAACIALPRVQAALWARLRSIEACAGLVLLGIACGLLLFPAREGVF